MHMAVVTKCPLEDRDTMASVSTSTKITSPFDQAVTFIFVRDLDASSCFYSSILRLPLVLVQRPPGGTSDVVRIYAITATSFIGLCLADPTSKSGTGVVTDGVILTLVTDSVDEWSARLIDENVQLEKGPIFNDRYNIYHVFFRDPDGHLMEIQQFRDPNWPRLSSHIPELDRSEIKARANQIFALIFGDMPYIRIGKGDLINGEILSEKSMVALFDSIQEHCNKSKFSQSSLKTFYDLGSGMGKPVIASALLCDWLQEFIGIEIQHELYEKSVQARDRFNVLTHQNNDTSIVKLHQGSFFDIQDWTVNGDVIFINSTAFTLATMKTLLEYAKRCKKGCYIVTLTHNLLDVFSFGNMNEEQQQEHEEGVFFELIGEFRQEMSWGEADFYLYFKQR